MLLCVCERKKVEKISCYTFTPSWSAYVKVYLTLRAHWDDHNKTHMSRVCLLSVSNNQPLCHLIWQLRSLSLSTACSLLCSSTWVKMEFLGARFTSWFTLQQQPTDAFMIRTTKLEPEKAKREKNRQERERESSQEMITSACYLFYYWYTEPIKPCFKKMNVVIVIVMIIAIYKAHGTRKHTVPW